MIELTTLAPYLATLVALLTTPSAVKWLIKVRRKSDDRAVCAHLYTVGRANRGGLVGSVGKLTKSRIEHAVTRLCVSGMVDRRQIYLNAEPYFVLAEGAEVLIDD